MRLIDEDGTQLGIKPIAEAFSLAQARAKDLIEISPGANPPVVKIVDFSKYRYERDKKIKESRKHQKAGLLKEIRLHSRISPHDLGTKIEHTRGFIDEKNKVRITVIFRGREMEHRDIGLALLNRIRDEIGPKCVTEQEPSLDGNRMSILLAPAKK